MKLKINIDAGILYDVFAGFLVTPYSETLNSIRLALRMSQKAFAEHIGVIPSCYYKLEAGHRRPSRKVYLRMVDILRSIHIIHFWKNIRYNKSENKRAIGGNHYGSEFNLSWLRRLLYPRHQTFLYQTVDKGKICTNGGS